MARAFALLERDTTSLPAGVASSLPSCAEACVSSYVQGAFYGSACANATSIGCLCSHYSTTGYTLGEVSFACVKSGCPDATPAESQAAYRICSAQADAVAPIHSVLTLLGSVAPSTAVQSTVVTAVGFTVTNTLFSSVPSVSISTKTPIANPSFISSASPGSTILPTTTSDSTAVFTTSSSTSASATTLATPVYGRSSKVTTNQAIGISLGVIGGILAIIALTVLFVYLRRRRSRKQNQQRHSYDFVDHAPPRSPTYLPQGQTNKQGGLGLSLTVPCPPGTASHSRSPSAQSISSEHTISQLLPDKPLHSPHIITQFARPFSDATRATVFEEDRTPGLRKEFNRSSASSAPLRSPYNNGMVVNRTYRLRSSPVRPRPPSLSLRIPSNREKYASVCPPAILESPASYRETANLGSRHLGQPPLPPTSAARISMPLSSAATYLPSYYTSNDSRTPVLPQHVSQHIAIHSRSPAMSHSRSYARRIRASRASDTSFESVDPDEPTPPEETDKRLSPAQPSPITGLRYPKVPRSSNQAIPRSPLAAPGLKQRPRNEGPMHSGTLLTKRLGMGAASDLEWRLDPLRIRNSGATSDASALATDWPMRQDPAIQRAKVDLRQPWQLSQRDSKVFDQASLEKTDLRGPPWEPEMTLTRREGALYLSVTPPSRRAQERR